MLEIANIKPVAKPSDPASQNAKAAQNRQERDATRQEFEKEYAATGQREETGRTGEAAAGDDRKAETRSDKQAQATSADKKTEAASDQVPERAADTEQPVTPLVTEADLGEPDSEMRPEAETQTLFPRSQNPGDAETELAAGAAAGASAETAAGEGKTRTMVEASGRSGEGVKPTRPTTAETIFISKALEGAVPSVPVEEAARAVAVVETAGMSEDRAALDKRVVMPGEGTAPTTRPTAAPVASTEVPRATAWAEGQATDTRERTPLRELRAGAETAQPAQAPASQPGATATPAPAPMVQLAARQETSKERVELMALTPAEPEAWAAASDARGTSPSAQGGLSQILSRADTPAMIGRQMAEALQKLPDRPVEIALSPKELGRVRMSISAVEAGITVTVVAERPETLDLMRRNIDQLAREFQAIGYESINFAFSGGEARQGGSEGRQEHGMVGVSHLELAAEGEVLPPSDTPPAATSGLDIRL